jgi:hypothetical protein
MSIHPDFSGTWRADFERSRLEIQPPSSSVFTIRHNDPSLFLTRTHRAEQYEDTFTLPLLTNGQETRTRKGDVQIRCTCIWKGNSLHLDSRVVSCGMESRNAVVYTMSEDGREIVAEETFDGPSSKYHNVWVLVREQPSCVQARNGDAD